MEKKLIDFDKVKGIRYLCSKCNKLVCEPFECLAWQGLESYDQTTFNRSQVSQIVDYCFHKHASFYRGADAECAIEEAILKMSEKGVESGD